MKRAYFVLLSCLVLASAPLVSFGQDGALLAQGTPISATMDTQLSSATTNVGDPFSMHVTPPYPNNDSRFSGATITGHVIAVTRASRGVNPQLELGIEQLTLNDGTSIDLDAQVTREQSEQQRKNGAKVATAVLGGLIFGNIIGKTLFRAAGGGLIGAAGGLLYGLNDKTNISIEPGSAITVTVARDIRILRQSGQ